MPLLPEAPRRRHSLPHISNHSNHWHQHQQPYHANVSNGNSRKRRRHSSFVESTMETANPSTSFGNFNSNAVTEAFTRIPFSLNSSLHFYQNGNNPRPFPDPTVSLLQQRMFYQQQSFSQDVIQQQLMLQQQQQQQFYRSIGSSVSSLSSFQPLMVNGVPDGTPISRKRTFTFESSTLPHLVTPSPVPQWQEYQGHGAYNESIPNLRQAISPDIFNKDDAAMRDNKCQNKCQNNHGTESENSSSSQLTIHRTIRLRLNSMTRETRLVQQNPPPIVIQTKLQSNTDFMESTPRENIEWAKPFMSIQIPANVSCIWKSNKMQITSHIKSDQNQHQVYLQKHSLLGEGAFATVLTVTLADSPDASSENKDNCSYYACKYIKNTIVEKALASRNQSDATSNEKKCTLLESKERRAYIQAESQLAYEAHLLGSLHHPNIIQLMGFFPITGKGATGYAPTSMDGLSSRSVLLTELLDETLAQKLKRWKNPNANANSNNNANNNANNNDFRYLEKEKISICQQLAEALEHVHAHNIAYRDLKPENVGFVGKTLKLLDFGLSREMSSPSLPSRHRDDSLKEKTKVQCEDLGATHIESSCSSRSNSIRSNSWGSSNSPTQPSQHNRLLRGRIGTMRYMAPEVCLEEEYDMDCDIYSYSVLCWEIWTHKTPYYMLTPASYVELVCVQDFRPPRIEEEIAKLQQQQQQQQQQQHKTQTADPNILPIPNISACALPKALKELLEKGWVRDPKSRIRWQETRQGLSQMETGHPEISEIS